MSSFKLKVTPAIPIELRHQIGELIEQHGYDVYGQGQDEDGSSCDIAFDSSSADSQASKKT